MPLDLFLVNPERLAAEVIAEIMAPPPPVDLNDWAVKNIRFGSESTFPGPFNPELFPYFKRPLEVLSPEHPARIVAVKKSAQVGFTTVAQIFLAGTMDLDPAPFLYVHPTIDNAGRWVKTKWRPMLRNTTSLARKFNETTSRDGHNSTFYQELKSGLGFLLVSGANSASSLAMISVRRQVQDDISKWVANDAGDPEAQSDSRSKAARDAKIVKIGTSLLKHSCKISKLYDLSTQEIYEVPCPHCGALQALEWPNMQRNIDERDLAVFTCVHCRADIENRHLRAINPKGIWRARNPGADIVGFYIWAAYSPMESWDDIKRAWIKAKGDPATEQVFLNDTVGEAYESAGEAPPWEGLRDRAEATGHRRGVIPVGALLIAVGIDVQGDRLECQIVGFGRDLRRWVIDYMVIDGFIGDADVRGELDKLIARTWPDEFGNRRGIDMAAIDGNAYTAEVFDWAKRHPLSKVMVVRGANSDTAPIIRKELRETRRDGKKIKRGGRFYHIGVSVLKSSLYKNLPKDDPLARGYCGFPKGMGDEYFRQLTSERRVAHRRRDGFVYYTWDVDESVRNEGLDTMIYAEAAATRKGYRDMPDADWDLLAMEREQAAPHAQGDLEDLMTTVKRESAVENRSAEDSRSSSWIDRRKTKGWIR